MVWKVLKMSMEGLEPPTLWFVAIDSNPLSYIPITFFTNYIFLIKNIGGRRELNPRVMVPQTITLPLGDARHAAFLRASTARKTRRHL